jgi:hypothetical protein
MFAKDPSTASQSGRQSEAEISVCVNAGVPLNDYNFAVEIENPPLELNPKLKKLNMRIF